MTNVIVYPTTFTSSAALRFRRIAALAGRSLYRAIIACGARRALDELPDDLLRDIGLARSDIPFVASALASGDKDPTRDARDRLNRTVAERGAAPRRLPHVVLRRALVAAAVSTFLIPSCAILA